MEKDIDLNTSEQKNLRMKNRRLLDKFKLSTKLDKSQLSKEMAQLSSSAFYIGVAKADAEYEMDKAKAKLKVTKARIDKRIREIANKAGKRKPTEKVIEQRIVKHPDVCQVASEYAEAKWKFNVCWAAMRAISDKGQQLTNMAYNHRKELEFNYRRKIKDKRAIEKLSKD